MVAPRNTADFPLELIHHGSRGKHMPFKIGFRKVNTRTQVKTEFHVCLCLQDGMNHDIGFPGKTAIFVIFSIANNEFGDSICSQGTHMNNIIYKIGWVW